MAAGFERVAANTGRPDRVIIIARDASTESASSLTRDAVRTIGNAPGIRHDASNAPLVSPELLIFVPLADASSRRDMFVTLRAVSSPVVSVRPEIKLLAGRMFQPGARELIVGRAAGKRLNGLDVGSTVTLAQGDWTVVGVFESNGDSHESELLTDVETAMTLYQRKAFNSMTVVLDRAEDFEHFSVALAADPTLAVDPMRESDYFTRASQSIVQLLRIIAFGMGAIIAAGAAFGALNAMYSASEYAPWRNRCVAGCPDSGLVES